MADFPYTPNPANVKRFFEHVQSAGVPKNVTKKYLEQVGFKTTNDAYIIGVLKTLGFLDKSGVPTQTWQQYRNRTSAGTILADAIRRSFSDLFRTYPDANRKDNEALRNFFSAHTSVAESTLGLIVSTFKTLCGMANFEGAATEEVTEPEVVPPSNEEAPAPIAAPPTRPSITVSPGPVININIQLQIPATDEAAIYDKFFAALKKHLFPQKS